MTVTPVTIATLVAGVVDRLAAKIEHYAIEPWPDKPETYQLKHQRGAFLVAYRGSDYGDRAAVDSVVQERLMHVDVVVMARSLANAGGAYAMLDMARVALTGHKLPGFDKLAPDRERFTGRQESAWAYALTFATSTRAVELPDDTIDVLLERLTLVSPFHTTEITND